MKNNIRSEYENSFCNLVGAKGARAFGLGRQALVILLKSLGVGVNDKIGVCSFTCLSVVEAVKVCGATPIYLDVDKHLCIEPQEILKQNAKSLKVVILQHTFGIPGRLDELLSACKNINAMVIEDCAHSLGCSWKNKPLGKFGEGAIYSFQWGKPYTTGQGGMLTVNSEKLLNEVDRQIENWASPSSGKTETILEYERRLYSILVDSKLESYIRYAYRKLRSIGLVKSSLRLENEFRLYPGYVRLTGEKTAKAGLKQLGNWPKLQQRRQENTMMIIDRFSKAGLALWPIPAEANVTILRYPMLTPYKTRITEQASKQQLDIAGWYTTPVHPLEGDSLEKVNYHTGDCPKAEDMISQLIHLPTGFTLSRRILESMIRIIYQN